MSRKASATRRGLDAKPVKVEKGSVAKQEKHALVNLPPTLRPRPFLHSKPDRAHAVL